MNNLSPIISVIVPCYNCADTIQDTLESLVNQTFKNFEIILINDGSTDDTQKYLTSFREKSIQKVTVIEQKNAGVSVARNRGIKQSDAEWISFLDADDIYHVKFLEGLYKAAQKNDSAYCRCTRNMKDIANPQLKSISWVIQTQEETMHRLLYEMGRYCFSCFLYRRDILHKYNIYFDQNTKYGEDREFSWKYLCHCKKIGWTNYPMYGYRYNPHSACKSLKNVTWRRADTLHAVKRVECYLEQNNCTYNKEVKKYFSARVTWAVAKHFAQARKINLYKKLLNKYNVKASMQVTAKDSNRLVAVASKLFLIHPMLFYFAISITKK